MTSAARATTQRPAATRAGRASSVPLIVGVAAAVLSLVLAAIVIAFESAPVKVLFDIPLPLVVAESWGLSLLGYLLTPVVVIACYGWDAIAQRTGMRRDVNFSQRTGYGIVLRWTVVVSILIGIWHILNLSVPLAEALGLS